MKFPSFVKVKETKKYLIAIELLELVHRNVKPFLFRFALIADVSMNIGLKFGIFPLICLKVVRYR